MPHNVTIRSIGRLSAAIVIVSMAGLLAGCAGSSQTSEPKDLAWPSPPEKARIAYVRSLSSEDDVTGFNLSVKDMLLGKRKRQGVKLVKPYGVHVDRFGRVLVTDTATGKLVVFDLKKRSVSVWGEKGKGALKLPVGVASDSRGRVYVTDAAVARVVVYGPAGNFLDAWSLDGGFERPTGIAVNDKLGRVYVIDTKKHQISILDMNGKSVGTIGSRGVQPGQFNFPTNLALDGEGKLYVVDMMNHRVQIMGADGEHLKTFGKNGDGPGDLARPKGIGVDSDGNIYVVDAAFNNFQIFNPDGQLLLFVGAVGHKPGEFWLPAGAYIDGNDKIYVVDQFNTRVQVFRYLKESGQKAAQKAEPKS